MSLPVAPKNDIFEKMTNKQMDDFKDKLTTLKKSLIEAHKEVDPVEACIILRKVFGDDFPVPKKDDTGQKREKAMIASSHSG